MRVFTIGHGTRPAEELVACVTEVGAGTVIDVRRFPSSRRNPQFNREALSASLSAAGVGYVHLEALGGRRSGEPGEEQFACIREPAFRSYAARMRRPEWQDALAVALADPGPCFLCAETLWTKCHRRLIAELLYVRGYDVRHLVRPGRSERHHQWEIAETRDGRLYLCGERVA